MFPPGTLLDGQCVVEIDPKDGLSSIVSILTSDRATHRQAVAMLIGNDTTTHLPEHPYRGQVLDVGLTDRQLDIQAVAPPTDQREELILPNTVWADIDRNIHGLLRNRQRLADLGLGVNRGVLLHGPPGTGKTQLVRTIIAETHGEVTELLLRPAVIRSALADAYKLAEQLAPSIVALEDADLVVGHRAAGDNTALVEFLTSVDGLMSDHAGVMTIATTNNPDAFDPAAIRSARFDRFIELPKPPGLGRRRLWERYLAPLDGTFDLDQLVRVTSGASGADIREIIRHAILQTDGTPTTETLTTIARDMIAPPERASPYL